MRYSKEFTFRSSNDQYRLVMQSDGNLVLYNNINGSAMWTSKTFGNNNAILTSQTNGNLAVDTENFSTELWDIDRKKYGNIDINIYQYGQIQDDGRFIYVKDNGKWEWIWDNIWHNTNRSDFTNKSLFLNKLNSSIKSNFINPEECDIKNIFIDENCSGIKFDQYKIYLSTMNDYCDINTLDPQCNIYLSKEFIDDNNNVIKADFNTKIRLLNNQEKLCTDINNVLNDRCIYLNTKKPEILEKVSKTIDLNNPLFLQFKTLYGDEGLFYNCMENNNIINNITDCIKLENNNVYRDRLISRKKNICKEDSNLLNSTCLKFNKENQLDSIKEECKHNKTDNCKILCSKYTDEFNDICFWENNQLYFILVIIISLLFGGWYIYKKRQTKNLVNHNNNNNNNNNLR
jgi:hypothetical protein